MANIKKWVDPNNKTDIPHLYFDEVNKEFWIVKRINGRIRKKNLKTDKITIARAKMMLALADLGDEAVRDKAPQKLLKDFHPQYIERKKNVKGVRASTLVRTERVWRNNLEPFWGNLTTKQVSPVAYDEFINWHRKYKPGVRVFNPIRYLNGFLNYLIRIGELTSLQAPRIEMPKDELAHYNKKKGRVITFEEKAIICAQSPDYLSLAVELVYRIGARKMEIFSATKKKVREINGRLYIVLDEDDTKTGLARVIPIPSELLVRFRAQMDSSTSEYVFPNQSGGFRASQMIDFDWQKAKEKAGIQGRMRFHDLRHTCATNFARMKVNPMMAVTLLGMSLRTYQKTYLNLSAQDLIEVADLSYGETRNVEKSLPKTE